MPFCSLVSSPQQPLMDHGQALANCFVLSVHSTVIVVLLPGTTLCVSVEQGILFSYYYMYCWYTVLSTTPAVQYMWIYSDAYERV
jgi:hypothetical protein